MTVDITSQNDDETIPLVKTTKRSKKKKSILISSDEYESRRHRCSFCHYKAARSNTLKMHVVAVHEGNKSFVCAHCSYRSARRGDLNRHLKTVHK